MATSAPGLERIMPKYQETAINFGGLPKLPDGYEVRYHESVEHYIAHAPDEWTSPITCDRFQARRWCLNKFAESNEVTDGEA